MMNIHRHSGPSLFSPRRTIAWTILTLLPLFPGAASAQTSPSDSSIGTPAAQATEEGKTPLENATTTLESEEMRVFVATPYTDVWQLENVVVARGRTWMLASQKRSQEDITVVAQDLKTGRHLFAMNWRPLPGRSLAISDDESMVACCDGGSRQLIVYDIKTQRTLFTSPLAEQESKIEWSQLGFSPDGKQVLLVHLPHVCYRTRVNGTVLTLYSVPDGKVEDTWKIFECGKLLSRVADSDSYLLAGAGSIKQVDIKTGKIVIRRRLTNDEQNFMLKRRNTKESQADEILALPPGEILQMAIASDGSKMAYIVYVREIIDAVGKSTVVGKKLRIWEFATGQVVAECPYDSLNERMLLKSELYFSPLEPAALEIMQRIVQEFALPRLTARPVDRR